MSAQVDTGHESTKNSSFLIPNQPIGSASMQEYSCLTYLDGIIALLDDPQVAVRSHAVKMLLEIVDFFWYEIIDSGERIATLATQLPEASQAWLLLSKLHFHLGDYEKSVEYALKAGNLFDLTEHSIFVVTIVAKAIDLYVEQRLKNEENKDSMNMVVDSTLELLVERLIEHCFNMNEFKQVIGIAIDTHRLDILEAALVKTTDGLNNLRYARDAVLKYVGHVSYKMKVLSIVAKIASKRPEPDFVFIADCLVAMQDAEGYSNLITGLICQCGGRIDLRPIVLQMSFNVCADASQEFLNIVLKAVKALINDSIDAMFLKDVISALDRSQMTLLRLEFLFRNNKADMQIMEKTKEVLSSHNSMHHSAITCSNAIMHCGTTNDEFLRKNIEWLGFASNWAKFTAASSLGVIHQGQGSKGKEVLKPYLPTNDGAGSPYSEGGAMFALGLINVRSEAAERSYFLEQLGKTDNEALIHGICLGMGSAAMSSVDMELVEAAKNVLYQDNAISGEAAAIAIGLILHGSGNEEIVSELLQYAHETQHEKTIRGISMAIALIFSGLREHADTFIAQLLVDKDSLLRYGGMWTVAAAYAGCSDRSALARLLHGAVSDANDDVRRASVTALGFVMCQNSSELPKLIELLTESYNPHVRYGAALALGIAFSGTGSSEAITLLKPMCTDFADFVRQGAYIALAMIMMQNNEATCPEFSWFCNTIDNVASLKHEDAMAKFGAVLAQGIINASGRNSIIGLSSPSGHINHMAVTGTILFCQFWHWYPFAHFLSFALIPTALIAVDSKLRIPNFEVICNAKASMFAFPLPIKTNVTYIPKKLVSAVLSTTAKAVAKAKKTNKNTEMEMEHALPTSLSPIPMEIDTDKTSGEIKPAEKTIAVEPESFKLSNLSRVIPRQISMIEFPGDSKYQPIRSQWRGEIIVVVDRNPEESSDFIVPSDMMAKNREENNEPAPPEPFDYVETA